MRHICGPTAMSEEACDWWVNWVPQEPARRSSVAGRGAGRAPQGHGGGLEKCGTVVINWEAAELIGGAGAQQSARGWLDFHKNLTLIMQQE